VTAGEIAAKEQPAITERHQDLALGVRLARLDANGQARYCAAMIDQGRLGRPWSI